MSAACIGRANLINLNKALKENNVYRQREDYIGFSVVGFSDYEYKCIIEWAEKQKDFVFVGEKQFHEKITVGERPSTPHCWSQVRTLRYPLTNSEVWLLPKYKGTFINLLECFRYQRNLSIDIPITSSELTDIFYYDSLEDIYYYDYIKKSNNVSNSNLHDIIRDHDSHCNLLCIPVYDLELKQWFLHVGSTDHDIILKIKLMH